MVTLLLVEDDPKLVETIKDWAASLSYELIVSKDGKVGLDQLLGGKFDLAILDWDLPSLSGVDACRTYRESGGIAPVLMLTGKSALDDKVQGFDVGVDDYLPKPFLLRELTARVQALLRRSTENYIPEKWAALEITLDRRNYSLTQSGNFVAFRPKEFALMEFLLRNPGQMFTADDLVNHVWENETETTAAGVRTCLNRMVKRLEEAGCAPIIKSSRAYGYWCELSHDSGSPEPSEE